MNETLARFEAIAGALREHKPRPDATGARFAAASLLAREGEAGVLTAETRARHDGLESGLKGGWFSASAPTGNLRWVYASLLAANDIPASRFLKTRERLRELAKDQQGPGLYAGGARAALVLSLASEPTSYTLRRFFELKRALTPPWWRRNNAVTDTFAAGHAAQDDAPETVQRRRDAALDVFAAHRRAKSHKHEGARLAALLDRHPREMIAAFDALKTARRENSWLKHRTDSTITMEWAAQGLSRADLDAIEAIMRALPKGVPNTGAARARLAHLIHTKGGSGLPAGSVSALSAVIAAQAASIAAITAASAAATSAAAASGS